MSLRLFIASSIVLSAAACVPVGPYPDMLIEPEQPLTTDDLQLVFPDNDATLASEGGDVSVQWYQDGAEVFDLADSLTVPAEQTAAGEMWMVSLRRVGNRQAFQDINITVEVDILNSEPIASSLTLAPNPAVTTDVLSAEFELEDSDEDMGLPYTMWTVNGVEIDAPGSVLGSSAFAKGDVVTFKVTPVDVAGSGEPLSATLTIQNSPGSFASARVEPAGPTPQNAVLTCIPEGWMDADNDPEGVRFTWERDGVQVGTESTFAVLGSPQDSRIRCGATPDDGDELGITVFSTAVIVDDPEPGR